MVPSTARPRPVDTSADHPLTDGRLKQLHRFQWTVRAALVLGVTASVCANVLHAQHNPIAQTIAAWPPLALMLTVELISRVPVYRRALAVVRLLATACIAGIAAYVSYFHMAAVVSRYGEDQPNPYLLPISVDGLIVVASVSLVELAGRIRTIRDERHDIPPHLDSETESAMLTERARSNGHASTTPEGTRPLSTSEWPPDVRSPSAATVPLPGESTDPPVPLMSPPAEPPPDEPLDGELPAADGANEPDENGDAAIDPELAALLPAARAARNALYQQHRSLTRDSLAAQLRHDGHTIRTSRVSALLTVLRNDVPATTNGRRASPPN